MTSASNPYMQMAIEAALEAGRIGEVPVGAVLVRDDQVIAESGNWVEEFKDPTAHAEMLVIRQACDMLDSKYLSDCDLYVTLEPCAMCAQAISYARIRRLYFGAFDPKGGGVENGARIFNQPTCHHKPEIYGGIAEHQCAEILKEFFRQRRPA